MFSWGTSFLACIYWISKVITYYQKSFSGEDCFSCTVFCSLTHKSLRRRDGNNSVESVVDRGSDSEATPSPLGDPVTAGSSSSKTKQHHHDTLVPFRAYGVHLPNRE